MKWNLFYLRICFLICLNSVVIFSSEGQHTSRVNDGPYIFKTRRNLKVEWIKNKVLFEDHIIPENFDTIKNQFNLLCNYNDLMDSYILSPDYSQSYNMIDSIAVISDIHGKYNTYINLLKVNGIIDDKLNWRFGKGHLVIIGDVFDRGNMVTEVLWHLFGLEKQAEEAGGMVHVLLGNHEVMLLRRNPLYRMYLNKKYLDVEEIFRTKYYNLYSKKYVLGQWLYSRPVIITINDIIFVHGGISIRLVNRKLTIMEINKVFSNNVLGKDMEYVDENEKVKFLVGKNGPVWFRGYFTNKYFHESRIDSILSFFNKKHVVVGHTTHDDIVSRFNTKIIGIDAGIKDNLPGELLIYKNGIFYKCYSNGRRLKL